MKEHAHCFQYINEKWKHYGIFWINDYLPCREFSCSDIFSCHCLHSWACICSTALSIGFIAADFFSPFLATTRVHRTLGSDQESFILMLVLAPMKDAHVVSSGRKTYSSGHPTAPAYDCSIALVGVVVHFSKLSACACAIWKCFRSEAHCSIADIVGTLVEKMLNGETLLRYGIECACTKEHKVVTQIFCMGKGLEQVVLLLLSTIYIYRNSSTVAQLL